MAVHPTQWTSDLEARYELLEEAGRGGMGVVYKARDRETGETVALKILKPDIAADRVAAERFLNEVRLSRRITHKNVTRVYEFTRAGSTAYLSMEYVEGESLRSIVERMGAVNVRKGIQIARQICAALHEAHTQGIIHRDLKPENVMIDKSGNVKVMDFGIARLLDASVTATSGGIIGTPAYMAPEQAEGKDLDARTDIYAVGLILYEIFTGKAAFTGDTPMVVALKQIREVPPSPRTIDPALPWELEATVMRCLEKDPALRFQSVEELDAALAAVSSSATTTTGALHVHPEARATGSPTWPSVASSRTTPIGERKDATIAPQRHETSQPAGSRRRISKRLVVAVVIIAAIAVSRSRPGAPVPFERFRLANGLEVILVEDHSAPTVAVSVTYNVGAKDDPPGREGLAHLFEHMLFNGSLNVGKGEHHYLVTNHGGQPNGQTFMDHTQVWETLPANQLDLALFLEADRMRSLRLDEARVETERRTVLAERQQRVDNQPYGGAADALFDLAYDIRAYKKTQLGTDAGLQAITLQEVNDFFRVFYAPNNAVLSVAGSFDPDEAREKIERYFEHIPAQPPAPNIDLSEREQQAERRVTIADPFAPGPRVYLGYKIPPGTSDDIEALTVLSSLLSETSASHLHQRLVRETEVAAGIGGGLELRKGPGLLTVVLIPAQNRDGAALLTAFDEVIQRLLADGVSDEEVDRVRTRLRLARATVNQQSVQRALLLGEYETRFGGASRANERQTRLADVSADDVTRVARQYLKAERRSVVTVVRGGTPAAAPKAAPAAVQQAVSRVERLNRAPVSRDLLRVALPDTRETKLDNGLTVQIAEGARASLISVRLDFHGAGSLFVPAATPALAIATGAMLREGTPTRSSRQVAEEFDARGVTVTWGQASDASSMYLLATGLSDTFEEWFPVIADLVVNASFPADELTTLKRRFTAEWQQRRSLPLTVATEMFEEAVYGTQSGRRIPTDAMEPLTSDQLRAWHRERYAPQNTIVTIAGAPDRGDALETVRDALGNWRNNGFTPQAVAVFAPAGARVLIVDRPGSVQTTLLAGVAAPGQADPDHLPLAVANRVLGGGPASRLFVTLRDERGLTYVAYSILSAHKDRGDWRAYSEITSNRVPEGLEAFFAELRRIGAEPVPAEELEQSRRSIVASFALTLEQLQQVAGYMAARRSYGLSADFWERYPERLMGVSPEAARAAAAKFMDFARLQVVAVGDASQLEPLLAPLGQVIVTR